MIPALRLDRIRAVTTVLVSGHWAVLVLIWLLFGAIFALVGGIMAVTAGIETSAWDFASYGPKYFLLSVGVMLTTTHLPAYVANGVTRREFAVGGGLFIAFVALFSAAVMAAGYAVEGLVYRANGLPQVLSIPHLYAAPDQAGLVVVEFVLVFLSHLVSGWLIGTAFARLGWRAIPLVVPALLPALATDLAVNSGWAPSLAEALGWAVPELASGIAIGVAAVLVGWAMNYLATRDMPVKTT